MEKLIRRNLWRNIYHDSFYAIREPINHIHFYINAYSGYFNELISKANMLLHYSPIPEIIFIGFIQTHKKRSHERPLSYNHNTIYYLIFSLKLLLYQSSRFLSNTSTTAATIINANLVVILFTSFFYHFLSIIM